MKLYRKELLAVLDACQPGLGTKGGLEQSKCYVFRNNRVYTFNDIILCEMESPIPFEIAVPAKGLRELLAKFGEDEISIDSVDGKLKVWVSGRRATLNGHTDVYLPIEDVELPGEWDSVPPELSDALPLAADCCGNAGDEFDNVCVDPKGLIACDLMQVLQFSVYTGVKSPCLVPGIGCKAISSLGVAEVSDGSNWIHWKTYTGLRASVRKGRGVYPTVASVFTQESVVRVLFPAALTEILERVEPFLEDTTEGRRATLTLRPGYFELSARNGLGAYEEQVPFDYDGPEIMFGVNPKLLAKVVRHGLPVHVTDQTMRVQGPGFRYAVSKVK